MPYSATVYKVMIASPSDVVPERNVIREVLSEWNVVNSDTYKIVLLPVGWETHISPAMGDSPQAIINKQILTDCDLLVGVFWTRIGTATGEYVSGTVEEVEKHIKAGKPVMLYFSSMPVHPDSVDNDQYSELKQFKESCKSRGIFETYNDLNDFRSKFYRQLQLKINQDAYFKTGLPPSDNLTDITEMTAPDIPNLSREAQTLLKEASHDPNGIIFRLSTFGGPHIHTNKKKFGGEGDPRARAIWEGALEELENERLIIDKNYKKEVFEVTRKGYEIAELINP
jgi:hypothetical protein